MLAITSTSKLALMLQFCYFFVQHKISFSLIRCSLQWKGCDFSRAFSQYSAYLKYRHLWHSVCQSFYYFLCKQDFGTLWLHINAGVFNNNEWKIIGLFSTILHISVAQMSSSRYLLFLFNVVSFCHKLNFNKRLIAPFAMGTQTTKIWIQHAGKLEDQVSEGWAWFLKELKEDINSMNEFSQHQNDLLL